MPLGTANSCPSWLHAALRRLTRLLEPYVSNTPSTSCIMGGANRVHSSRHRPGLASAPARVPARRYGSSLVHPPAAEAHGSIQDALLGLCSKVHSWLGGGIGCPPPNRQPGGRAVYVRHLAPGKVQHACRHLPLTCLGDSGYRNCGEKRTTCHAGCVSGQGRRSKAIRHCGHSACSQ